MKYEEAYEIARESPAFTMYFSSPDFIGHYDYEYWADEIYEYSKYPKKEN